MGEEMHQQGRVWNCSHSQLHAQRSLRDHPSVIEAKVALVPGATAPPDDTFARVAVGCADDKLSAIALALEAVLVRAAMPFARAPRLRRLGGRRRGRQVSLKPRERSVLWFLCA